jgi:glycosyltransferase involved in cell wall biosynthesis
METQWDISASPRPRHCFILSWPFELTGGVNQTVLNLIVEFQKAKQRLGEPLALELTWSSKPCDTLDSGAERTYLQLRSPCVHGRPFSSALGFVFHLPATLLRLRRLCREKRIGVLNKHYPDLEAVNLVLLKLLGFFDGKVVISLHGSDIRSALQETGLARRVWRFLLRNASTVVACSDGLKTEAKQLEPRANVVTIYNGIDVERFSAHSDPKFRWQPELKGKRIIVNVGQFEFRKGHDILLKAFRRVREAHDDVALVLAGFPGPTTEPVRNMIRDLNLSDSVFYLGSLAHEKIYDLLKHSTLFALATRWRKGSMGEGFAIALLEAAAAKLPVVATASCGVEEIIRDGETGRVVPLEDDAALATAICELLDQPDTARAMAEKLYAVVREQFTWENAAEQYAALSRP